MQVLASGNPQSDPITYLRGLNALRFLVEAFRARPHVVTDFREAFAEHVVNLLIGAENKQIDLLNAKYAVESVTFLPEHHAALVLTLALTMESPWIAETAFRACRYVGRISTSILTALDFYVCELSFREIRQRRQEVRIALSFHDQFDPVIQRFHRQDRQRKIYTAVFWTLLLIAPFVWVALMSVSALSWLFTLVFDEPGRNHHLRKLQTRTGMIDIFAVAISALLGEAVVSCDYPCPPKMGYRSHSRVDHI